MKAVNCVFQRDGKWFVRCIEYGKTVEIPCKDYWHADEIANKQDAVQRAKTISFIMKKEIQTSISWLSEKGIVSKVGNKYILTSKGKNDSLFS